MSDNAQGQTAMPRYEMLVSVLRYLANGEHFQDRETMHEMNDIIVGLAIENMEMNPEDNECLRRYEASELRRDEIAGLAQEQAVDELTFMADSCPPPAFCKVILELASDYLRLDAPEMMPNLLARLADGLDSSGDEE